METLLSSLWREASPGKHEKESVLGLIEDGRRQLRRWRESGFRDLEGFFCSY